MCGSNANGVMATDSKATLHIPPAHNLPLPMLCACSIVSSLFCLLLPESYFVQIIFLEVSVFIFGWVLKDWGSIIFAFLKLEQTLKINWWEVLCDVYYLSMKSVSLSNFCSHLHASTCHRHESTFAILYLVRHEILGAPMHM